MDNFDSRLVESKRRGGGGPPVFVSEATASFPENVTLTWRFVFRARNKGSAVNTSRVCPMNGQKRQQTCPTEQHCLALVTTEPRGGGEAMEDLGRLIGWVALLLLLRARLSQERQLKVPRNRIKNL